MSILRMAMPRRSRLGLLICLIVVFFAVPAQADLVKKSKSGICHDSSSPYFSRTKNFKPFSSLAECLGSGGRLPKVRGGSAKRSRTSGVEASPNYSRAKLMFASV
jgi:hypothetical protein